MLGKRTDPIQKSTKEWSRLISEAGKVYVGYKKPLKSQKRGSHGYRKVSTHEFLSVQKNCSTKKEWTGPQHCNSQKQTQRTSLQTENRHSQLQKCRSVLIRLRLIPWSGCFPEIHGELRNWTRS